MLGQSYELPLTRFIAQTRDKISACMAMLTPFPANAAVALEPYAEELEAEVRRRRATGEPDQ